MERYNFTNPLFLFKIESMRSRFYILFCLIFLVTCDDGDILTIEFDFDKELQRCDNDIDSYLLYDTRTDPNESLTLLIPRTDQTEAFFTTPEVNSLTIDESTVRFNYRTYNVDPDGSLCDVIGNPDLVVKEDYEADSGTVQVTVTVEDDDNDGISSEDEYGPGGISDPQDWDLDGIPDYLDEDDDNDNVETIHELDDIDADGDDNPFTEPLDTDGDGIADYLDDDDDNDGIPTRLEDISVDKNPRDPENFVIIEGIDVYRYLSNHPDAMQAFDDSGFIFNYYTRSVTTHFEILNAGLEIINSTYIDFGIFENSFEINNEPEED